MPVTVKLSRRFYETFGDEIANELVQWFNTVDQTYRTELRELIDVNFARFDAKLEQRIAELRAELRTEMHGGFAALRTEMQTGFAVLRTEIERQGAALIKWTFVFWLGMVATIFVARLI